MLDTLKELIDETSLAQTLNPEERLTSEGVNWQDYETLLAKLEDNSHYRVSYLDGVLEILSPSSQHEKPKTRLASLIDFYFYKKQIQAIPLGSTTFRNQLKQAGAEPDESYCIGSEKAIPDLAIEVIVTSSSINKLEVYRRLGVAEVWFWRNNQLSLYHLREEAPTLFEQTRGYEQITISELLPELNISLLEECTLIPTLIAAFERFEAGL
ncbi:MAG: Uma2 family endonuclease [Symploca sp. SIO1C4]|uniref:Uma2 family endonuclease n=1 Tax=Symploca sp. SIO1C4 TaxID=2607765 RepID=A0A6B3NP26_9CYAN|nr:Uma2 family endonuclease [Symploca sp. SIO1C4]